MRVKAFLAGMLIATAACRAATVTFLLAREDNGSSNFTNSYSSGSFSVWAWTSRADNLGLAAFSFTVDGNVTTLQNVAPRVSFATSDDLYSGRQGGFIYNIADGGARVSTTGSMDTFYDFNTLQYGVGQEKGDIRNSAPPGYSAFTSQRPIYGDRENAGYPDLSGRNYFLTYGQKPVLLAVGTYASELPTLVSGAANVFQTARNTRTEAATPVLRVGGFSTTPEPSHLVPLLLSAAFAVRRCRR